MRAMILATFPLVSVWFAANAWPRTRARWWAGLWMGSGCRSCGEGVADPLVGDLLLAVDALGVDPQEDIDAVAGSFGHVGG